MEVEEGKEVTQIIDETEGQTGNYKKRGNVINKSIGKAWGKKDSLMVRKARSEGIIGT